MKSHPVRPYLEDVNVSRQQPDTPPERTPEEVLELVREQLGRIRSESVRSDLAQLLVTPTRHLRNWDYGPKGQQYPCWTVAEDPARDTAYVYSDCGFGPEHPWP